MLAKLKAFIRKIWTIAPVATVVLGVALAAILFFSVRSVAFFMTQPPLSERAQPVAAWMTPRFIARSWQIPPRAIIRAIDAPIPPVNGPMSLAEIAEYRGVPVEEIILEIKTVIGEFHPPKIQKGATPATKAEPEHD